MSKITLFHVILQIKAKKHSFSLDYLAVNLYLLTFLWVGAFWAEIKIDSYWKSWWKSVGFFGIYKINICEMTSIMKWRN